MAMLTPQQDLAARTRDVSVVLSSGAGCGKTHVLTERYLSHLRTDGAEVGQIVAITFTDRAARQMRGRIRQAVIRNLRAAATDAEAEIWARHLRGLETAPISTIHAFCNALLRQHAFDADLDPRFEVLEDVLATNLATEATAETLQKLLTAQGAIGDDLRQLVLLYGWAKTVDGVQQLLRSWDEGEWARWLGRSTEEIAAAWHDESRQVVWPGVVEHFQRNRPGVSECLRLLRRHPPAAGPLVANVARLLDDIPRLAAVGDATTIDELIECAKVRHYGKKAWPDVAIYEPIKNALEVLRGEFDKLKKQCPQGVDEALSETVEAGKRFLRVATAVQDAYQERKRLIGVLDFQDLLASARDLLRGRSDLRARLQDRYRFVLVDELQDVDPLQMELVEYLCGGGLTTGRLFAVGDANQSIYRFRGADVKLFQDLRRRLPHEGRQALSVNFRSQPAILDFTNALVRGRLTDYEPLTPHHPQISRQACVEFLWSPRGESGGATEARTVEAEWIARRVRAMTAGERLVVDREEDPTRLRPVRLGDVVLLFRSMSNVHLYESALRQCGLPYYLVGGRAFYAQQEIYDLLNLLRTLENPHDSLSLAGTLRSPFCCVSDEALLVLAGRPKTADAAGGPEPRKITDGLWTGLLDESLTPRLPVEQRERVARARRNLTKWRRLKNRVPIAGLLNAVFADSGFDATTQFEALGDRKLANLWKLIDLARTFDRTGMFGLAAFISRLGDLVNGPAREEQAATQPENADVVRLMTIHQAKGLEFPVVFVPDFGAEGRGVVTLDVQWDARLGCVARPPVEEGEEPPFSDFACRMLKTQEELAEWGEELRTLYVACTRAQDYLVLSAALGDEKSGKSAWMLTLGEAYDLQSGQCLLETAKENEPLVIVHDLFRPPPTAAGDFDWTRHKVTMPDGADHGVGPIERNGGERPRTTAFHKKATGRRGESEKHGGWLSPRQRVLGIALPRAERLTRAVLSAWDFKEEQGWRRC